jgi:peptidoglycan-associated lipoprotein
MRSKFLPLLASVLVAVFMVTACESDTADSGKAAGDGLAFGNGQNGALGPVGGQNLSGGDDLAVNVGDRVFFAYDSSELNEEARATLTRQAQWLNSRNHLSVTIEGHCDERGTREYNLALGERRAVAAKNFLVAQGVSGDRIQTVSYGKERPAVPGSDESAWAQNRRSVTVVSAGGATN